MLSFIMAAMAATSLTDAMQALEAGNYAQAVELYRQHIASEGTPSYEALYGLARSLAFAGRHAEALEAYNQVLAAYPGNADALLGRGRVYSWMDKRAEAEADFEAVLQADANNAEAWEALSDLQRSNPDPDAVDAFYLRWSQAFQGRPEPLLAQARYFMSQRRFPLAREAVVRARDAGAPAAEVERLLSQINRQPGALDWESQIFYEFQAFQQTQVPWHTLTLGLGHYFDWGFVALQGMGTSRFGVFDQAVGADVYADLWPGAYGNARVMFDWNPQVLPRVDLFTQLYQVLFTNFELSGGYRLMAFPADNVHFFNLGFGGYFGNWYVGLQPMFLTSGQGPGGQIGAWARYIFNTADDYVDLRAGVGRRIAIVGAGTPETGPQLAGQTNFYTTLTGQYFINPHVGFYGVVNYNYDDQFPSRYGFTVGNKLRW